MDASYLGILALVGGACSIVSFVFAYKWGVRVGEDHILNQTYRKRHHKDVTQAVGDVAVERMINTKRL